MMLTQRERVLAWLTVMLVVLGCAYFVATPMLRDWKVLREDRTKLTEEAGRWQALLDQKSRWDQELAEQLAQLPEYPPDQKVTSDVLRRLDELARQSELRLPFRKPEDPEQHGDLFELIVNCKWEGRDDALVAFLVALQGQDAKLDIRELTVKRRPDSSRKPDFLTGNFKLESAYRKSST